MQKNANLVDFEKIMLKTAATATLVIAGVDTAENGPSKVSREYGVRGGSARGHLVC